VSCMLPSVAVAQSGSTVVRLPLPKYDGTLTPYTFELGYPLMTLVYDTLLWRDARGTPRPWLARSVTRSADGRQVTVRLRRGVRWHDGRPLTAADVAFTFDFVARRFHPRFTPQLSNVESAQATDRRTVTIDLRQPSLGFDDQPLADLPILPSHLWRDVPEGGVPPGPAVGSGPYRLVRAQRRSGYTFRANPGYFRGRPEVDRVRVPIIRQESKTYSALQRRDVDMLPVSLPDRAAERLGGSFGINLSEGPSYSGTALLFNLRKPPFDRPAVRTAVSRALDLDRIARSVEPAVAAERGYIHPASRWASRVRLQRFDLRAARRALSRLDLPAIRILTPDNDPIRREAGRQVALALRRAGVSAGMVELQRDELGKAIGEDGSAPSFEAAITSTPPLVSYDPDFLQRLFGSDPGGSPLNYAGYSSDAFAARARDVAAAPTRAARRRAVDAELKLLATDLPAVPLFFSQGTFAFRPAIHNGWTYVKGSGILDKRSFLTRGDPSVASVAGASGPGGEVDDSGSVLEVLRIASLFVLAAALALGAAALVQRLRSRSR
ncbi:MAG: ABC transporter substrate-binding protein, partial [Thermoleophilaceae bacterium]